MIAEQLQAARAAHWRQNQNPILTLDDAQSWLSQHPLCLYLPRHAQLPAPAPSFVEACLGQRVGSPSLSAMEPAQAMLVRLVASGTIVPLNLFGAAGEQPDFLAHRDALPAVLSLRADPDWKHAPQKSSGHKISPLVLELWKVLEKEGTVTADQARDVLGRELTEAAVLRGLCELWQALRVTPVYTGAGDASRWEMMRVHHRDALASAGSTGQVTAISLLVSMYLQSVYSATGEEIEVFLSPVTSRSRVREAVRGLSATRQIQSLSMDAQTYYFLENGLPAFAEVASNVAEEAVPTMAPAAGEGLASTIPAARPATRKRQATTPPVPAPAVASSPASEPIFRRPKPSIPLEISPVREPAAAAVPRTFARPAKPPFARPSRPAYGAGAGARSGTRATPGGPARPRFAAASGTSRPASARPASARPPAARSAGGEGWKSQGRPAAPGRTGFPARPPRTPSDRPSFDRTPSDRPARSQSDRPAASGAGWAGKERPGASARPSPRPVRSYPPADGERSASSAGRPPRPASAPRTGTRPYSGPQGARPSARPGTTGRSAPKPWALPGRKSGDGPRPPRVGARGDAPGRPAQKRYDRPAAGGTGAATGRPPARSASARPPYGAGRPAADRRGPGSRGPGSFRPSTPRSGASGERPTGPRPPRFDAGSKPAFRTGASGGPARPRTGPPRGDRPASAGRPRESGGANFARPRTGGSDRPAFRPSARPGSGSRPDSRTGARPSRPPQSGGAGTGAAKPWARKPGAAGGSTSRPAGSSRPPARGGSDRPGGPRGAGGRPSGGGGGRSSTFRGKPANSSSGTRRPSSDRKKPGA